MLNIENRWKFMLMGGRQAILCLLGLLLAAQPGVISAQNRQRNSQENASRAKSRADTYYSDAAGFQNNGAYELAAGQWKKLLDEYPNDPRADKAAHYLGYCYIKLAEQTKEPDYSDAIAAFKKALSGTSRELREETLINLSWCQINQAREAEPGSREQRDGLREAQQGFTDYLSNFGGGDFVDQALFYLGEIEYTLGNPRRAIGYYKKLLDAPRCPSPSCYRRRATRWPSPTRRISRLVKLLANFRLFCASTANINLRPRCECV